jgi:hypothetical protein
MQRLWNSLGTAWNCFWNSWNKTADARSRRRPFDASKSECSWERGTGAIGRAYIALIH